MRHRANILLTVTVAVTLTLVCGLLLSAYGGGNGSGSDTTADGYLAPAPSLLRKMVPTSRWMPAGWSFRQVMPSDVPPEFTEDVCGITRFGEDVKIINGASGYYVGEGERSVIVMLAIHTDNGAAVVDTFTTGATCDEWEVTGDLTMRFSAAPDRNLADGGWMRAIDAYGTGLMLKGRVVILRVGDVVVRSAIFRSWSLPEETLALWHTMLDHAISVATTGEPLPAPTTVP